MWPVDQQQSAPKRESITKDRSWVGHPSLSPSLTGSHSRRLSFFFIFFLLSIPSFFNVFSSFLSFLFPAVLSPPAPLPCHTHIHFSILNCAIAKSLPPYAHCSLTTHSLTHAEHLPPCRFHFLYLPSSKIPYNEETDTGTHPRQQRHLWPLPPWRHLRW